MKLATVTCSVLLLSGASIAALMSRQSPSDPTRKIHDLKMVELDAPANHSSTDFRSMALALRDGTPLPAGYTLIEDWGRVIVRMGTYVDLTTGFHSATVVVIDDAGDLESVEVLDASGTVIETASQTGGGMIKSNGQVIATLPVLLNISSYPTEYTIRMTSPPDESGERDIVSQVLTLNHQ